MCGVESEADLKVVHDAVSTSVPTVAFREEDLGGSLTALAAGPVSGTGRRLFRKFRLLNDNDTGAPMTSEEKTAAEPKTAVNKYGVEVYRSRWGYHPVDFAGYTVLRLLSKAYWRALNARAAHRRWSAKLPKNRKGGPPSYTALQTVLTGMSVYNDLVAARTPRAAPDEVSTGVRDRLPQYKAVLAGMVAEGSAS